MARNGVMARAVLIVDDNAAFVASLREMLEAQGYAASHADTAAAALALLREPPCDCAAPPVALIDADLRAPGAGVDLIPRLHAEQPELVCVLMTGELDSATALAALRRGAYDHLDKSCAPAALSAVLERCFDRVALLRERALAYDALHRAKEDAEAASRAKSGFLATMSHELRTPLNAIIGFSEMMQREVFGALGNEHYRAYAADIHESGTHLLQIINDILDLSKAEAGKLELHEEVFDLRDTVRSVRQLISERIRDGGLTDVVQLPPGLPLLRADERKTKQVLLNLIINAAKFTPRGGRVEIAGHFDAEAGLILSVTDTGIGIAPTDLARVLQPFEQVDSSFSRAHPGTGLGLPLVKAIMDLHGGRIELHSEVGVGTRVTVIFPASRAVPGPGCANARSAA